MSFLSLSQDESSTTTSIAATSESSSSSGEFSLMQLVYGIRHINHSDSNLHKYLQNALNGILHINW